ncbi:aldehyde dehydrogenase family protein [Flammeovirga kamogawensis]|uniref:Aldehyde dehydrogenase n=1 Tax=Flammeovirga kamogawensis TaxID=373891 RepID=A0ABX8GRM2_9BACT|nr:aldehyde dehydrogenase family protein [Flammeovirga kamogawensis]MBB6463800.1 aldehyde dehydrogenase (NAD+) [Flammeovirga kamogawensis]QWG06181.1 aldehyde dehydrogenase family protein [Flammeovirga kamogawensis]TRX68012.1 aldehyde dehydrogenase family protein [Flammeovirga kamogawensis]
MNTSVIIDNNTQNIEDIFIHLKKNATTIKKTTVKERIKKLEKLEHYILDHREEIHEAIYKDLKKNPVEVDTSEILTIVGLIRHTKKHLKSWMKPNKVSTPLSMLGTSSYVLHEPKGVCLIIAPWNYPFYLAISPLIYAIAAGNTVAIKPSELSEHTSLYIQKMVYSLYSTDEVIVILGGVGVSTTLLKQKFNHIFFTGSSNVGKVVMKAAVNNLASVTLELGGKSPTVICKDADLKDASDKITWGKFLNAGQTCIAPDYALIHKSVEKEFVEQMTNTINEFYSPNGELIKASPDLCRIINKDHFNRLKGLLEDASEKGATIIMNGEMDEASKYMPPTLVTNVTNDMRLMQEEIFGPIYPIKSFDKIEEAFEIIEEKEKPLALYIFAKKKKTIKKVLQNTTAGGTCINETILHINNPDLPFGGINNSGIGKSHGKYGFVGFSNQRAVLKNRVGLTSVKPVYPPYGKLASKLTDFIIKYF